MTPGRALNGGCHQDSGRLPRSARFSSSAIPSQIVFAATICLLSLLRIGHSTAASAPDPDPSPLSILEANSDGQITLTDLAKEKVKFPVTIYNRSNARISDIASRITRFQDEQLNLIDAKLVDAKDAPLTALNIDARHTLEAFVTTHLPKTGDYVAKLLISAGNQHLAVPITLKRRFLITHVIPRWKLQSRITAHLKTLCDLSSKHTSDPVIIRATAQLSSAFNAHARTILTSETASTKIEADEAKVLLQHWIHIWTSLALDLPNTVINSVIATLNETQATIENSLATLAEVEQQKGKLGKLPSEVVKQSNDHINKVLGDLQSGLTHCETTEAQEPRKDLAGLPLPSATDELPAVFARLRALRVRYVGVLSHGLRPQLVQRPSLLPNDEWNRIVSTVTDRLSEAEAKSDPDVGLRLISRLYAPSHGQLAALITLLLGMHTLYADNLTWGGCTAHLGAFLWGVGVHGFSYEGLAGLLNRITA